MTTKATVPACVLLLVCFGLSGCQSLRERTAAASQRTKDLLTWNDQKETDPNLKPEKMVAIWSESIIYGPDSRPTRGLGGRLYFYNADHQAVPVTGELAVYAYDDQQQEGKPQPDRKYVISAEQFQEHHSASEFGDSYSVWVPWDQVGGGQKAVSVLPIFKTTDGQIIVGDHARNLLSGRRQAQREPNSNRLLSQQSYGTPSSVQHASYTNADESEPASTAQEQDPPSASTASDPTDAADQFVPSPRHAASTTAERNGPAANRQPSHR